jgi:glycosyltransferase involved in cell wall biosynthesis
MRILWISPYLPWPTTGGNKVRQFQLLRCLAQQGHRITLLIQSKTPLTEPVRAALAPLAERLIVLPRRRRSHPLTLAAVLLAPYPVIASVNGLSAALARALEELLQESWDAVHVEHSYGLQSLLGPLQRHHVPFVLTEHNVESVVTATSTYHPRLPRALLPALQRYDVWRYRHWEREVLTRPTRLVAVTPEDSVLLAQITGRAVDVIANGVDARGGATVQPDYDGQRALFVGNFDYQPNGDAVIWTVSEILPRVWQRRPQVRLVVCGHNMPPQWRTRWPDPRIEWQGFVDDLAAQQRRCALLLAPLRAGGGSKLKVLEAMAAGLAVLTTAEGVSGLAVQDGRDYCQADDADALVRGVIELIDSPDRMRRLGGAGRAYVQRHHDWQTLAARLVDIYRGAGPEQHAAPAAA